MSRLPHLLRGRRGAQCAAALTLAALAATPTAFSGASLTSARTNPGNVFRAATITLTSSAAGQALLDGGALRPGATVTSSTPLRLVNGGDATATLALAAVGRADTPASPALSRVLNLRIDDVTGAPVALYDGTLAGLDRVTIASVAPGGSRLLRFTLSWPAASADPALQGARTQLTFRFTATS